MLAQTKGMNREQFISADWFCVDGIIFASREEDNEGVALIRFSRLDNLKRVEIRRGGELLNPCSIGRCIYI